jgi:hypothetical protein
MTPYARQLVFWFIAGHHGHFLRYSIPTGAAYHGSFMVSGWKKKEHRVDAFTDCKNSVNAIVGAHMKGSLYSKQLKGTVDESLASPIRSLCVKLFAPERSNDKAARRRYVLSLSVL